MPCHSQAGPCAAAGLFAFTADDFRAHFTSHLELKTEPVDTSMATLQRICFLWPIVACGKQQHAPAQVMLHPVTKDTHGGINVTT